jgi:hypothetical protein
VKTPIKQPPATPKKSKPTAKQTNCKRYKTDRTPTAIRCALTIKKKEIVSEAANATQYFVRLKFFGSPFQAAYPITPASNGKITKKPSAATTSPIDMLAFGFTTKE